MINGLDIYYSKNIGKGLKPVSSNNNNNKQNISIKVKGLKRISTKGRGCKKIGRGLKILQ